MEADFDYSAHVFSSPTFRSVVDEAIEFFGQTPLHHLPPPVTFLEGGVYALYYVGGFEPYSKLSILNKESYTFPIYVGKAVPLGWRKGHTQSSATSTLYQRLREHTGSINQVQNLKIEDFRCRFMILKDIESDLVVPVEAGLIRKQVPLWNTVVDGFGNHDPGAGRYNQAKSEWDILHPGRKWAERLTGASPNLVNILEKVQFYFGNSTLT
jgi:hypothetical protein